MRRFPLLAASALIATSLGLPTLASPAPAADPSAKSAAAATPAKPTPPRKATPEQRAEAERLDPLARAAFWTREADVDPADVEAGVRLSAALRALGQYPQAIQGAQRVLVFQPNNSAALLELARDFLGQGQGFYAIDPAKHAQALAPRDWRPLSLLGVAYAEVHRDADAQAAWTQALSLSPNNPDILSNMAMALAAQGDAPEAEVLLRRAVAQPGASLRVRQNLSLVLGVQGKLAEAETLLRENLPPEQAEADLAYLQAFTHPQTAPAAPIATPPMRTWDAVKGAGG